MVDHLVVLDFRYSEAMWATRPAHITIIATDRSFLGVSAIVKYAR